MLIKLFRIILPVSDIDQAAHFYGLLLNMKGERVSPGRHYFDCGETILACFDPQADGDGFDARSNQEHMYFAVKNPEAFVERAQQAGCQQLGDQMVTQPWGERCFYGRDPFGNPFCIVDEETLFTGDP